MVRRHYGVRTDRYKLIDFYNLGEWELYDLKSDPREMNNIYNAEGSQKIVAELKRELEALRKQYQVPEEDPDKAGGRRNRGGKNRAAAPENRQRCIVRVSTSRFPAKPGFLFVENDHETRDRKIRLGSPDEHQLKAENSTNHVVLRPRLLPSCLLGFSRGDRDDAAVGSAVGVD